MRTEQLRRGALAGVLALALLACTAPTERAGGHEPPRDGTAGIQLSGTFAGRQLALSDGAPALLAGALCAQHVGSAEALCFRTRDIDGTEVVLSFLNPAVILAGANLAVGSWDCSTPLACAQVEDEAVVEVAVGGQRQRATSGSLALQQIVPGSRYVGTATLSFRDGGLSGSFDVVPRPETPSDVAFRLDMSQMQHRAGLDGPR